MAASTADDRAPLSRQRIVQAAIDIADAEGLGALSMRRLAADLGYEAMSLYNHVANKGDLLDAMADAVAAELERPAPDLGWRPALRADVLAERAALTRHPWATTLLSSRLPGPARLAHMEWRLRTLADAGLPDEVAHHGFHALDNHALGHALAAQAMDMGGEDPDAVARSFVAGLDPDEHAHVIVHVHQHLDPDENPGTSFEFVLDLLLDGLARTAT